MQYDVAHPVGASANFRHGYTLERPCLNTTPLRRTRDKLKQYGQIAVITGTTGIFWPKEIISLPAADAACRRICLENHASPGWFIEPMCPTAPSSDGRLVAPPPDADDTLACIVYSLPPVYQIIASPMSYRACVNEVIILPASRRIHALRALLQQQ